ncbi:MAG TPA: DUF1643 domain-containing protein, partial [Nitrospira sp.]|nr:DUF1643 domain-containing protein [Nitrospira sp.]
MKSSAIFSECGLYRYELRREWASNKPPYCALMLNPSTADATRNDPTVVRQLRRASHSGYGSLIVLNLGAGRNTDPKKWLVMPDPIGPKNFDYIRRAFNEVKNRKGIVVVGWGSHAINRMQDVRKVIRIAESCEITLHCLGLSQSGQPVHPLYVSYRQQPVLW